MPDSPCQGLGKLSMLTARLFNWVCLDASASSYSMPEYLQPKVAVWTSRGWILVRLDGCGTTDRRSLSARARDDDGPPGWRTQPRRQQTLRFSSLGCNAVRTCRPRVRYSEQEIVDYREREKASTQLSQVGSFSLSLSVRLHGHFARARLGHSTLSTVVCE